jgi:hypothetical protein
VKTLPMKIKLSSPVATLCCLGPVHGRLCHAREQTTRPYAALVLFSICILAGACGNGLPPISALTVTITPPMATLAVETTVHLTGNASGFTQIPAPEWEVVESGINCTFLVGFT